MNHDPGQAEHEWRTWHFKNTSRQRLWLRLGRYPTLRVRLVERLTLDGWVHEAVPVAFREEQ